MNRPTGVVVIAILYWLGAFGLLCMGAIMAIGFSVFGAFVNRFGPIVAGLGVIGGLVFLGIGAAVAIIGYGLFQLREWARITAIVFAGIGLVLAFLSFLHPFGFGLMGRLFRLGVNALIIWYLIQPQIRGRFSKLPQTL
jgi:hypothetical protein